MIRLMCALVATLLQSVGCNRMAERFDPVMKKINRSQEPKTPNLTGNDPSRSG